MTVVLAVLVLVVPLAAGLVVASIVRQSGASRRRPVVEVLARPAIATGLVALLPPGELVEFISRPTEELAR